MIRCIVAASYAYKAIASQTVDALRAVPGLRPQVELQVGAIQEAGCNIVLLVVGQNCYAQTSRDLQSLRQLHPMCTVVALCDGLSEDQLLGLLSLGVSDFVVHPVAISELAVRLQRAAGNVRIEANGGNKTVIDPRLKDLVGTSPAFSKQLALVPKVAACNATVLLLGETGTGKELFARAIHYLSPRNAHPMIAVNCGAIPIDLIESELFGHVRGAFTTASDARKGLISEAEGGTLFLDEIDALSPAAQVKLLRFLEDKQYRQLGSNVARQANVRIIAASNRCPLALVAQGSIRQDLYFRLSALMLTLPALRDRGEDISLLALHFLQQHCIEKARPAISMTANALRQLLSHQWAGNVRELRHVVERAVLMSDDATTVIHDFGLNENVAKDAGAAESFHSAKTRTVQAFERSYIEELLGLHQGNISHAARAAKKDRRVFFELIRKHHIHPEAFRQRNPGSGQT
jgi:two-component system, NtrC family, response regulator GlrR